MTHPPGSMKPNADLEFAIDAVRRAGGVLLSHYRNPNSVGYKKRDDPVTEADLAADELLRVAFAGRFPSDGWLSEETADSRGRLDCRHVWVVDPLDGTREFVRRIPEFAISVARVDAGVPQYAVVFNPAVGDLFWAERGRGAFGNGERLAISPQ